VLGGSSVIGFLQEVGPELAPTTPGGCAVNLDGSNDTVTAHHAFDSDELTVEAWVKPTSLTSNQFVTQAGIVEHGNSAWSMLLVPTADPNTYQLQTLLNWNQAGEQKDLDAVGSIPRNQWVHLAMTYDGFVLRRYVNGIEVGSDQLDVALSASAGPLRIGNNAAGLPEFLGGDIDNVRIWSDARSAAQIVESMEREPGLPDSSLWAQYTFDECSGQHVADSSGSGHGASRGSNNTRAHDDPSWVSSGIPIP
ncbi:MAG: LamG domain-containing protein, partial [Microthrixaceae bacterium]